MLPLPSQGCQPFMPHVHFQEDIETGELEHPIWLGETEVAGEHAVLVAARV